MRSSRSVLCLFAIAATGCDDRECTSTFLTYETFGAPFIANWCRGCHSLGAEDRHRAPPDVNFDSLEDVRSHLGEIRALAGATARMPPSGGPTAEERAMLVEWIDCGAP